MTRLSQKGLLNEGIGSMLKKAAQAVGGAVGGVGGALKAASDAGTSATWGGTAKGGTEGAKKGWKGVKKALTGKDAEFNEMLEDRGWMLKGDFRAGKGNMRVFDVVELDYDETGQPKPGRPYPRSAAFKYEGGKWVQKRDPGYLRQEKEKDGDQKKDGDQEEDPHASERAEEADTPPETPQPGAPEPEAPAAGPEATKPKFFDALRQWKIETIGPNAATASIGGHQLKEFLISLNVPDPDRVIKAAGLNNYGKGVSNKILDTIKATLQSRDLVSEDNFSQKNLLQQLHMLHS